MTGFLIPIREFTPHALSAVQFAIEFGKRNKARLFFLFIDESDAGGKPTPMQQVNNEKNSSADPIRNKIEEIIFAGKTVEGMQMETHQRSGDFIQEVHRFVMDRYITEIVVSLPGEHEDTFEQKKKEIQLLLKMTHCRILTVKQKNRGSS